MVCFPVGLATLEKVAAFVHIAKLAVCSSQVTQILADEEVALPVKFPPKGKIFLPYLHCLLLEVLVMINESSDAAG